jgi:hypothetical protein
MNDFFEVLLWVMVLESNRRGVEALGGYEFLDNDSKI